MRPKSDGSTSPTGTSTTAHAITPSQSPAHP